MNIYEHKEEIAFEHLSTKHKIDYFTQIATKALQYWNLPHDSTLKLINYTENATFRVCHEDKNWILRIHRLWYTDKASVLSEMDWIKALAGVIRVPCPILNVDGEYVAEIDTQYGRRIVDCFCFENGEALSFDDKVNFEEIGRIIAKMHIVSENYVKPSYYKRIDWDLDKTFSERNNFHNEWYVNNAYLNATEKQWISSAASIISDKLNTYGKNKKNYGLIHSDCRFANILVDNNEYILLDFDDCGEGWYVYDLASVFGFNEDHPYVKEASERLMTGYQEIRTLSEVDIELFDTFLLFRRIGLIGPIMFFEKSAVLGEGESLNTVEEWHDFYHKTAKAAELYCKNNMPR